MLCILNSRIENNSQFLIQKGQKNWELKNNMNSQSFIEVPELIRDPPRLALSQKPAQGTVVHLEPRALMSIQKQRCSYKAR